MDTKIRGPPTLTKHLIGKKREECSAYLMSAAIDIGTSSSCYAFSYKSSPNDVRMNKNWNNQEGFESYKTSTAILTNPGPNGELKAFGFAAEREYGSFLETDTNTEFQLYIDFKMTLYREKNISSTGTMVKSRLGLMRPLTDLYVMTLVYLSNHMLKAIEESGASPPMANEIRWVLSVPATWTDQAKSFLRLAAFKAKLIDAIESPQLVIILEATAAALFCQLPHMRYPEQHAISSLAPVTVTPGDQYLVIDAGAGTVDYTALESAGEAVKEIAISNGGDWGGGQVDRLFLEFITHVLGKEFIEEFAKKYPLQWFRLEQAFQKAKTHFGDSDEKKSMNIELPVVMERLISNRGGNITTIVNQSNGVKENNGYLVIAYDKANELFTPTIEKVCEKTSDIWKENELHNNIKIIFLVGGFALCKPLQKKIKELLPGYRVCVPHDARNAVVQGAVIYGHNPNIITRVAKKTYGVGTFSQYNPKRHVEHRKSVIGATSLCPDIFLPFVQKGELLMHECHGKMVVCPVVAQATSVVVDFYYLDRRTSSDEVIYCDNEGVTKHGRVRVEMPNLDGGANREVELRFTFNDEITVEAVNLKTGSKNDTKLTFDYDIRR